MVTIYTTPTCAFCHVLKEYLHDNNVKFTEKNIVSDNAAQQWVVEHTGRTAVPVSDIDGKVVVGFDRRQIEAVLKDKKILTQN